MDQENSFSISMHMKICLINMLELEHIYTKTVIVFFNKIVMFSSHCWLSKEQNVILKPYCKIEISNNFALTIKLLRRSVRCWCHFW